MTFRNIIWKYEKRNDNTCAVKIYARVNGKIKYFQVKGVYVEEKLWNEKQGRVKKQHPLHQIYNAKIIQLRNEVETHFLTGGTFKAFEGVKSSMTVIQLFEDWLRKAEGGGVDVTAGP
jgi:hypothetical protein